MCLMTHGIFGLWYWRLQTNSAHINYAATFKSSRLPFRTWQVLDQSLACGPSRSSSSLGAIVEGGHIIRQERPSLSSSLGTRSGFNEDIMNEQRSVGHRNSSTSGPLSPNRERSGSIGLGRPDSLAIMGSDELPGLANARRVPNPIRYALVNVRQTPPISSLWDLSIQADNLFALS